LPFDEIDKLINDVEIWRLSGWIMTPNEELFAKFFNNEKALVAKMDDLQLRAHREELSKIAFEARVRLTAINEEGQERNAKSKRSKGYETSIESDAEASDAINRIKERQKKLTKTEKLIENLMKLPGIDRAIAEKMVSATTQLEIRNKPKETITVGELKETIEFIEKSPIFNPFTKPPEPSKVEIVEQPKFKNPFIK
jgi:hypothetical protein